MSLDAYAIAIVILSVRLSVCHGSIRRNRFKLGCADDVWLFRPGIPAPIYPNLYFDEADSKKGK